MSPIEESAEINTTGLHEIDITLESMLWRCLPGTNGQLGLRGEEGKLWSFGCYLCLGCATRRANSRSAPQNWLQSGQEWKHSHLMPCARRSFWVREVAIKCSNDCLSRVVRFAPISKNSYSTLDSFAVWLRMQACCICVSSRTSKRALVDNALMTGIRYAR